MIRGEWSIALEEQAQAFADYNGAKGRLVQPLVRHWYPDGYDSHA